MDGHVMVAVPAGHTVQVHPPATAQQNPAAQTGMIHDPAQAGALAAMNAALPLPAEQKTAPKAKPQPERKAKPAEKTSAASPSGMQAK